MSRRTNTAVWFPDYNRWQIKVQKDGVRKTFYSGIPGRAGQRECNKKADDFLDENITERKIKFEQVCNEYLKMIADTTGGGNVRNNEYFMRMYIVPTIGNVKLENLTEKHLQSVIVAGYKAGLSKKTLMSIMSCLKAILKYARISRYTNLHAEQLSVPKSAPVYEKRILQPDDVNILFTKTDILYRHQVIFDNLVYAYRFQVITGLRPGELIGLMWSDIEGDNVYLKRAINVLGETTKGKNENAKRSFKLTETAQNVLKCQKEYQQDNEIESEFVFSDKYGEHLSEHTYYHRWCRFRDYNGISLKVSLYELRHTFVSMVKRLPEGYLKGLVGHSKSMDTYGVYSHEIINDKSETANLVQNILSDILKSSAIL